MKYKRNPHQEWLRDQRRDAKMPPPKEKHRTEIMEMARIACATIPDTLAYQMDISDELFITVRDYLHAKPTD